MLTRRSKVSGYQVIFGANPILAVESLKAANRVAGSPSRP